MGTSLCPVGNHKVGFKSKSFESLANEVKEKLDGLKFENAQFLKEVALREKSNNSDMIARINDVNEWAFHPEDEYYNFSEDKYLNFKGPFELNLQIDASKILFFDPSCRYMEWLEMDGEIRNEWRKYFFQVIRILGGDRVIYLADNSHPLEKYLYSEIPLKDVEVKLIEDFGEPKKTFGEVANRFTNSFFVDRFAEF